MEALKISIRSRGATLMKKNEPVGVKRRARFIGELKTMNSSEKLKPARRLESWEARRLEG